MTLNKWKATWESIDTNTYLSFTQKNLKQKDMIMIPGKNEIKVNNSAFININIEDMKF